MKKILIAILFISLSNLIIGQGEGLITFEQKVNLHRRIPPENEDMKKMMPEFRTSKFELIFKENESLYRPMEEDEDMNMGGPGGGGGMTMRFRSPETIYYRNHESEYSLTQRNLFEKKYLVEDTLRISAWKLGNETKIILGHPCMKASLSTEAKRDTQVIKTNLIAWFTTDIYAPFGPEAYGGLPGMILGLDVNNGEMVYTATVYNPAFDSKELKAPTKGEKIAGPEFQKLMDERMKEFNKNNPGGRGQRMIRF